MTALKEDAHLSQMVLINNFCAALFYTATLVLFLYLIRKYSQYSYQLNKRSFGLFTLCFMLIIILGLFKDFNCYYKTKE